jgi:hypothetical protein
MSLFTAWVEHWLDGRSGVQAFDLPARFYAQEGRVLPVCDGSPADCSSSLTVGIVLVALAILCGLGVVLPRGGRAIRLVAGTAVCAYTLVFIYEVRNRYILDQAGHDGLFHFLGPGVLLAFCGGLAVLASAFVRDQRATTSTMTPVSSDDREGSNNGV